MKNPVLSIIALVLVVFALAGCGSEEKDRLIADLQTENRELKMIVADGNKTAALMINAHIEASQIYHLKGELYMRAIVAKEIVTTVKKANATGGILTSDDYERLLETFRDYSLSRSVNRSELEDTQEMIDQADTRAKLEGLCASLAKRRHDTELEIEDLSQPVQQYDQ